MNTTTTKPAEGWAYLLNSPKWHYFRNRAALCGRWAMFVDPSDGYQQGGDNSPDNCAACKRKRAAEVAKAGTSPNAEGE